MKRAAKKLLPLFLLNQPALMLGRFGNSIKDFQGAYAGETCVIIGNGPSLNEIDFNEVNQFRSFGVNGIFYKTDENGFIPDFYVVEDLAVMRDNLERIKEYGGSVASFFPSLYRPFKPGQGDVRFFNMDRRFYEPRSPGFVVPQFSKDANKVIFCNQSVTFINLQLAYYMGFSKVLLVGMDNSYTVPSDSVIEGHRVLSQSDDPNHFHPDYFGKGKVWHDPKLENVALAYKFFKIMFEGDNREIINCSVGGNLHVFKRARLNDFL